jgi:hypothetical protein
MEYDDFHPTHANDIVEDNIQDLKILDPGYNKIHRTILLENGKCKRKKIEAYSSGGVGTRIRDAETGHYYNKLVGSRDEDSFFKVSLSTGECKCRNGSNTLYYISPAHYSSHFNVEVDDKIVALWKQKQTCE